MPSFGNLIGNIEIGQIKGAKKAIANSKSQLSGASMASLSQDSIMRFPVVVSSSIDINDAAVLTKALERQYAAFAFIVLSSSLNIDNSKYATVQDYIKDIHNNNDAPNLLDYTIGVASNIKSIGNAFENVTITNEELYRLWYGVDSCVNMESLNSLYLPNKTNISKLERVLESKSGTQTMIDAMKNIDNKNNGDRYAKNKDDIPLSNYNSSPKFIESKVLTEAEPTMISGTIYVNDTSRHFVAGVKTMCRLINSAGMINNLTDAVESNSFAFKLIKWTKGELKFFRDIVFGISQARNDALSEKTGNGWFAAMRRRKQNAKLFIGGGRPLSPINTIICTEEEVARVKAQTNIDLHDPNVAKKLIKDLYLIGFMIYDPINKICQTMLDGDATNGDFVTSTIDSLKRNNGKDFSAKDFADFAKNLGR